MGLELVWFTKVGVVRAKILAHFIRQYSSLPKVKFINETLLAKLQVKISTITNQSWDRPGHHGKIVASNDQYLSYALEGRNGYVLRLIRHVGDGRALFKGFVGAIVDVAFCHADSNLLACVDQGGNLYIWDLDRWKGETLMQA